MPGDCYRHETKDAHPGVNGALESAQVSARLQPVPASGRQISSQSSAHHGNNLGHHLHCTAPHLKAHSCHDSNAQDAVHVHQLRTRAL